MKRCLMLIAVVMICLTACDKPDVTEPDDKQEQTGNNGNENEGGNEDGTGNGNAETPSEGEGEGENEGGNEDGTGNGNAETPSEGEGEGETEKVKSMTITLEKVTATKAYFKASTKKTAPDIEIGIYYSQYAGDHIYDCERVWDYDLENGECELVIKDLDANTTYYYRPYLFINGTRELGDELSFTTADYSITVDVTVNGTDATFSGIAELEGDGGILYSTESQLSASNYIGKINSINGEYSYTLTGLSENTTYYFCTYYWSYKGDAYVYGDVRSFTIPKGKYFEENKGLSLSSAIDLSSSGTANCYIVSKAGLYKIKAVKGNDESQVIANASTSAILWETFGTNIKPDKLDLIKEFCYKDGYIVFRTADTYREGNAVIAVKDAEENTLWSWHIWLTDQPQGQIYDTGTMMDRNLGATSSTKGDVGALGLLYQWGRKDPFLGFSSIRHAVEAESTIIWPSYAESDALIGTIEYATANPTTFIASNGDNQDWYYTGSLSTDNTRWTASDKIKSIYDPCPVGWRIPDGGSDGFWAKAGFSWVGYDNTNKGMRFNSAWYPASGSRSGDMRWHSGNYGCYWSCSPHENSSNAYYLSFNSGGSVNPADYDSRAHGNSVRCIKE